MRKILFVLACCSTFCLAASQLCASALFSDDFGGTTINSGWTVVTPTSNSQVNLTGSGSLRMYAIGKCDYYAGSGGNFAAPRIYQAVDAAADWEFETKINIIRLPADYSAITLYLYYGQPLSPDRDRVLEYCRNVNRLQVQGFGYSAAYSSSTIYFKLRKEDTTYSGWYSYNGTNWIYMGQRTITANLQGVGYAALRNPWDGVRATEVEIEYFMPTDFGVESDDDPVAVPEPMTVMLFAIAVASKMIFGREKQV